MDEPALHSPREVAMKRWIMFVFGLALAACGGGSTGDAGNQHSCPSGKSGYCKDGDCVCGIICGNDLDCAATEVCGRSASPGEIHAGEGFNNVDVCVSCAFATAHPTSQYEPQMYIARGSEGCSLDFGEICVEYVHDDFSTAAGVVEAWHTCDSGTCPHASETCGDLASADGTSHRVCFPADTHHHCN
jgi:hypothetical protein